MESDGFLKQQNKSSSAAKQCEMDNKLQLSSKGTSFIKVLGRDFSKQLQLPEEFTTNLNGYVPRRFIIESGVTRKCWRVDVEKDGDGRMYFRDGWADFVEAHSLEVGNFLLFEYEEQSIFQVRIYGHNGCERKNIVVDSKGGHYQLKKNIDDEDGDESEAVEYEPGVVKYFRKKPSRLAPRKYIRGIYKKRHGGSNTYKRTAQVSISQNKLCFTIVIHNSKKHQFDQLTVPKAVSLKMKLPDKDELKFQDAQAKKYWTVTLGHRRDGRAIFCHGWRTFMKENKVAPGDKLKFVFISDELVQFHLTKAPKVVEHEFDEATKSLNIECKHDILSTHGPTDKAGETKMTASYKKHPCDSGSSFSVTWKDSCARTYLYMPKSVAQAQNLKKKETMVLRDPEGKCWPLEVKHLTGNRVVLARGWVEFWKGYGITTGDLLTFKFVSEYLIHLSISRSKPQLEPDFEDTVICLETDNEAALAIEPGVVVTQEEFDAATKPEAVITQEEFDAATTQPVVNRVMN